MMVAFSYVYLHFMKKWEGKIDRDLFFEILENNPLLNIYDLEQIITVVENAVDDDIISSYYLADIDFFQNLINFMEENNHEILNIKRLKKFLKIIKKID